MIVGIMSDTHGNRRLMHRIAETMVHDHHVDLIVHLGDNFDDAEELLMAGYAVDRVPGLWCAEYRTGRIPKSMIRELDGLRVAWAHAEQDLPAKARKADILFTGHTHQPVVEKKGAAIHLNPGHLISGSSRGAQPSYGLVHIAADHVRVAIVDIGGRVFVERRFARSLQARRERPSR